MTNWKALAPDCVPGYWFTRFSTLHSRLTEHLQTCVVVGDVPPWMTKGKTTLIQKGQRKEMLPTTTSLFHACLLTSVLAGKVYAHLSEKNVLPDE